MIKVFPESILTYRLKKKLYSNSVATLNGTDYILDKILYFNGIRCVRMVMIK